MKTMNLFGILPVIVAFLAVACQTYPEDTLTELPQSKYEQESDDFENYVKQVLTSSDQVHESFGQVAFHEASRFKAKNGTEVMTLPVFRTDSQYIEALIIATESDGKRRIGMLQHGQLFSLPQNVVSHYLLANLFLAYNEVIFPDHQESYSSVIGYKNQSRGERNLTPLEDDENTYGLVEYENCTLYFLGTKDDPYRYFMYADCYTDVYWEESPNHDVIIDAGGSGGGGGSEYRNCSGSIICFPLVKYPKGSDYATKYPKLTEYLKNQIPTIASNTLIVEAIKKYTGLSAEVIKKQLRWGEGPEIRVKQLDNFCATCNSDTYGIFDGNKEPNAIYIDSDLVMDLESSIPSTGIADSFAFLVGVTLLHELVHLGDWTDGSDYPGEEGHLFEKDVYGQSVWRSNAQAILKKGK
ncbi:hypothetical protein [Roseivirga sp.]|uniref:hypothetical protein n=1 Tax=Roseivirga sp. TaxID=1964215 RepID=UPI003B517346